MVRSVLEPKDSMSFIGRNPRDKRKNIFIATGDSGNGMTHGTIAGMLLTDILTGRKNKWASLYNPSRKPRRKPPSSKGSSNGGRSKPKKFTLEAALTRANMLARQEGIVVELKQAEPRAFYRDNDGKLHSFSAVCTHLGCTVSWNDSEASFDCPCHGSRFSYAGLVVNGPANDHLSSQATHKRSKAY